MAGSRTHAPRPRLTLRIYKATRRAWARDECGFTVAFLTLLVSGERDQRVMASRRLRSAPMCACVGPRAMPQPRQRSGGSRGGDPCCRQIALGWRMTSPAALGSASSSQRRSRTCTPRDGRDCGRAVGDRSSPACRRSATIDRNSSMWQTLQGSPCTRPQLGSTSSSLRCARTFASWSGP